jgi:hypothetical protein
MHLPNLLCAAQLLEASSVAAEAQLSAQQRAPPWELTGAIGTVIMDIGADITFIIGTAVVAGSAHPMEDHMWCRLDIAIDSGDCHSCVR